MRVQEPDLDSVLIEEGGGVGDPRQDPIKASGQPGTTARIWKSSHLQVINPLPILLESHTSYTLTPSSAPLQHPPIELSELTRIITKDHHIEQSDLDQIRSQLLRQPPLLRDLVQGTGLGDALGELFE